MQNTYKYTFIFLFISIVSFAQKKGNHQGPINWLTLEEADSLYKIEKRPVFIDVYTDWCGWCKRMDASTFKDKSVAAYLNANFYAVKLNAETKDTITFNGKTYTNSQSVKAKEMLAQIKEDTRKYTDSIAIISQATDNNLKNLKPKLHSKTGSLKILRSIQTYDKNKDFNKECSKALIAIKKDNKIIEPKLNKSLKKCTPKDLLTIISTFKNDSTVIQDSLNLLITQKTESDKVSNSIIRQQNSQIKNLKRRSRKTTHDIAIDLCRGKMSYPTFIILFNDLKANMPLKGFQKVPQLIGHLAFIHEGAYKTTRDAGLYNKLFQDAIKPDSLQKKELVNWVSFETALSKAKNDGKKILVHIINKNSVSSNIMDKASYRTPSTAKKINSKFHAVKLYVTEKQPINYKGNILKNVNGVHQLSLALMQNNVSFPTHSFLDNEGNLIMRVPQFFLPEAIDPVLDYFIEEGYRTGNFGDWQKAKSKNVNLPPVKN